MVICRLVASLFPTKRCILFSSFSGKYCDNPKYISIELKITHPDLKQVWVVDSLPNSQTPNGIDKVKRGSFKYYYYLFLSRVVVDNSSGLRTFVTCSPGTFQYMICKWLAKKSKKQYNISTWHGTPLKKIGLDSPEYGNDKAFITNADYSVAGCEHTFRLLSSSFRNNFRVFRTGTPRNDILCNNDVDINQIKRRLGLPTDKRIILFAPTFRKNPELSGLLQLKTFNYNKLITILKDKFGGEWCFVYRVHTQVQKLFADSDIIATHEGCDIRDGNTMDDMAEYLYCSDILLTDYSSSMFDFLITKKPCFLYVPDVTEYISNDRGVYMSMESLPFPQATSMEELYSTIINFDMEGYRSKVDSYQEVLGNFEDGKASKRIADDIYNFFETGEKYKVETVSGK